MCLIDKKMERREQRKLKLVRERIEPELLVKYGLTDADEVRSAFLHGLTFMGGGTEPVETGRNGK